MRPESWIAVPPTPTVLLVLGLAALGLAACSASDSPTPLPTVDLEDATDPARTEGRTDGGSSVTASAVVVPVDQARLAFPIGGLVEAVDVRTGDRVEAGQALATLTSRDLEAAVKAAKRSLGELTSPGSIAAAQEAVAAARQAVDEAQLELADLSAPGGLLTAVSNLEGRIHLAEEDVRVATSAYRAVESLPDGHPKKAAALVAMTDAQLSLDALVASYHRTVSRPSEAEEDAARAGLEEAEAALEEAEWFVAALQGESVPDDATGSGLAQLARAKDELAAAEDRLGSARLVSPIAGTVTVVATTVGEYAAPGQVVIVVSDIANLRVETTDLSERDVTKVELGQKAAVFVEALDREVEGRVSAISPVADTLGGDVVYEVTIDLDSQLDELRPGMSAEVRIDTTA